MNTVEPGTRIWKPISQEQADYIALPHTIFEAFFGGCVKSGKTELLMVLPLILGLYKYRRFKGLMLRRSFPEFEEMLQRMNEYYPKTGAIWKPQARAWEWKEFNSRVRIGHVQHEKDIKDYDTDEYQFFAPDELTSYTEFMFLYIAASRTRGIEGADLLPIVRTGGMPGGIGHGWVRKRYVEPCREGKAIIKDKDGNKRIFIKAKPIRSIDPDYYDRLKLLPPAEYLAKMGDWWTFSGQVFSTWRIEPLKDEPLNAKHVIQAFEIPKWWPKLFAMDVGYKTYGLWGAISPDGRLYIYREKHFEKEEVHDYAEYVRIVSENDGKFIDCVLDHTAFDASRGETTASLFAKYSKMTPRPADKGQGSRVAGKSLLQDLMRWHGAEQVETPIPRLQVFDTCELLVNTIPLCVYDKKDGVELDDIAEFVGDEPIDTVRYLARSFINFSASAKKQFEEFQRTAQVVRNLEITGDMTAYYRQMERLEARRPSRVRRASFYRRRRVA